MVQHHKDLRLEPGHLPANLRTDGTAGTRHEDPPAVERTADRCKIRHHFPASEQVLDARLSCGADRHGGAHDRSNELAQVRDDLHHDLCLLGDLQTALNERGRGVRHRKEYLLDLELGDNGGNVVDGTHDRHAHQ